MTAEKIQPFITIDTSGLDLDALEIMRNEKPVKVRFTRPLYDDLEEGKVTLPDGTTGFSRDDLQLAFQNALIEATGMCVLEMEYHRAGHAGLTALARSVRGEGPQC